MILGGEVTLDCYLDLTAALAIAGLLVPVTVAVWESLLPELRRLVSANFEVVQTPSPPRKPVRTAVNPASPSAAGTRPCP